VAISSVLPLEAARPTSRSRL